MPLPHYEIRVWVKVDVVVAVHLSVFVWVSQISGLVEYQSHVQSASTLRVRTVFDAVMWVEWVDGWMKGIECRDWRSVEIFVEVFLILDLVYGEMWAS